MLYEASLSGVLRIIFWIIVVSFIIRLIARMALPYVMKKAQENMQQRMRDMHQQQRPQRPEGDVSIHSASKNASHKSQEGEYVDFVEIKD